MEPIVWLADLHRTDAGIARDKGANLGELVSGAFPVPTFVVTEPGGDRGRRLGGRRRLGVALRDGATRLGLTSSLCGQEPSNKPAFAAHLVRFGITSVPVDPGAADRTRRVTAGAEQELLLEAARSERLARAEVLPR